MRFKFILPSFLLLILFTIQVKSQKLPFSFGKVSKEDFKPTECSFYPSAKSMIIGESGSLKFGYSNDKGGNGWNYDLEVTVRKRIFDITDASQANIDILVYEPINSNSKEEISRLKAFSYNLEKGKVVKEKVNNKEFYETRINDYWVKISFAVPYVKKGTIIEYSYVKESDFIYNLSTWEFQSDIPKAFSKMDVQIPEYFNYQISQVGSFIPLERNQENKRESFKYNWESLPQQGGKVERGTSTMNPTSMKTTFVANNVPPLFEEPLVNNEVDLPARIEFQLVSTLFPNSTLKFVAGNYNKFNAELLGSSSFGDSYLKGARIKDIVINSENDLEKSVEAYNKISDNVSWNKSYSFTSSDAGRKIYKDGSGTIGDINLTLLGLLKDLNIEAYPVILSTRGHGIPHPIYPSYKEFNYVIIAAIIDGDTYFCDATSGLPFGTLPLRCRNGKGFLVNEPEGKWVNLKLGSSYDQLTVAKIKINDEGVLTTMQQRMSGYAALDLINEINEKGHEKFTNEFKSEFNTLSMDSLTISEINMSRPVTLKYSLLGEQEGNQTYYIQPVINGSVLKSPFTRAERQAPIDFPYGQSYKVITQLDIPEGYNVELPEPVILKLPNNDATYIFNLSQIGNKVSIMSQLKIDKTDFTFEEYGTLKTFYEQVAQKNQEVIVLTKQ